MSPAPTGDKEDDWWEMEDDLPSLANQAAIELDDYRLGHGSGFAAVQRLAARLAEDVTETSQPESSMPSYDPLTIGIVSRAIDELVPNPTDRPTQISDVVRYATEKTKNLQEVSEDPTSFSEEALAGLRDYCLALSESASASEWPPEENDPRNRSRR